MYSILFHMPGEDKIENKKIVLTAYIIHCWTLSNQEQSHGATIGSFD